MELIGYSPNCAPQSRKMSPGAKAGARIRVSARYCALLLGAGVTGGAGFAGAGIASEGLVAGLVGAGAICVAGARVSLDAVLVPFCPG